MNAPRIQSLVEPRAEQIQGRRPLALLLHALNQPLTGLQCSMELALGSPRRPDQYVQTLREGLELAARMRILVEALRELADLQQEKRSQPELIALDSLLAEIVGDLRPVGEAKCVRLELQIERPQKGPVNPDDSAVRGFYAISGDRHQMVLLAFRLVESGLSLAATGSTLQISLSKQGRKGHIVVSWIQGAQPKNSPFSPPELGLIIAQAGWEQAGAEWAEADSGPQRSCSLWLPLAEVAS
jgi:signal transduction histidine kinase